MIKSMTGFAKIEMEGKEGKLYAEGRALNNRYLEINIKLPKSDYLYEQKLREVVKRYIKRGKVDISIKWERATDQPNIPKINDSMVKQYIEILKTLKKEYGLKGNLAIENIMNFRDIIAYDENNSIPEDSLLPLCENLAKKLNKEKAAEGRFIQDDLSVRLDTITRCIEEIEKRWPLTIKMHEDKLKEKVLEITKGTSADEFRMLQELAIYMERLDITEEIVRLKGHIEHFRDTLDSDDSVGRKLDFIIQEMVRETNTLGSKSNDLSINERVIQTKVEIEKMREQVQNVE